MQVSIRTSDSSSFRSIFNRYLLHHATLNFSSTTRPLFTLSSIITFHTIQASIFHLKLVPLFPISSIFSFNTNKTLSSICTFHTVTSPFVPHESWRRASITRTQDEARTAIEVTSSSPRVRYFLRRWTSWSDPHESILLPEATVSSSNALVAAGADTLGVVDSSLPELRIFDGIASSQSRTLHCRASSLSTWRCWLCHFFFGLLRLLLRPRFFFSLQRSPWRRDGSIAFTDHYLPGRNTLRNLT